MLTIDALLVGGVAVGLEGRDEGLEAGRKDNEVAGAGRGNVGMGVAGGNENRSAGADGLGAVGVTEGQLAFNDVPGFVVGLVDVERGGAAAAPFVDGERVAGGRERHSIIIPPWGKFGPGFGERVRVTANAPCRRGLKRLNLDQRV